ncbi:MAG: GDSL-type esterase/lipase family protein [Sandaracinaceae bacterium]
MSIEAETTDILDDHPQGVWRAAAIALFVACFTWIPYVVPGLEELRVIGPGDGWPLADLIQGTPRQGGAGLAGALQQQPLLEADDDALMESAPLPDAVEVTPREAEPTERPPTDRAQVIGRIAPEEYAGLTREIEDPHHSMRHFYRRLARVERDQPVLARMGVYGTSTNGADRMTSQLRRLLQRRFGDGGKGWVPMAAGWRFQRHQDVDWEFDRWRTYVVNRSDGPLDRYGYGGVLAIDRNRGAESSFGTEDDAPGTSVSTYRIFHQAYPEGGTFLAQVDDGPVERIDTASAEVEDRVHEISVPSGAHELHIRATAPEGDQGGETLRMYGVTMEEDGPGVVVDGLALIGAFTRVLRLFDRAHLAEQVRLRDPDLLVFWMGANDAVSESVAFVPDQYVTHYRGILRRYQDANPDMACMVMSILDKGERVNGRITTRPRVPRMVEAQREAANAEGCAFFDTYQAMGGDGTMRRWYTARPRLVTDDLGHLTAAGSRVMGTLLYRALLKGFDDWIAEGQPAP